MNEPIKDPVRDRLRRIFSYIRELTRLRTPPVGEISSYPWSLSFSRLPSHPTIQHGATSRGTEQWDGTLLRVVRPNETKCPELPLQLKDWVKNGWDQISNDPIIMEARNSVDRSGQTKTQKFRDDPTRENAFAAWVEKRNSWKLAEKPVREAAEVFSNLFNLLGGMQRESEKYQLYLGDGHLVWSSALGPISHPLLLQKVELEFNSSVPEFVIRESEDAPDLYSELLRFHELDGAGIQATKQRLSEGEVHPLEAGHTSEFLKFLIQRFFEKGQYFNSSQEAAGSSDPHVFRDPVLFLGTRTQSFVEALDKLIEAIPKMEELPEALYRIVGFDPISIASVVPTGSNGILSSANVSAPAPKEIDYLLTKPANKEQERIISRLETSGSVLVQGPPGTGKSHTIANVIGHLLANGKTVLVASHTSKALRVVREKVAAHIRPLCVSVLDNDVESKAQLEESINGIVGYLSRHDKASLTREIDELNSRREQLKKQRDQLQEESLHIRKQEYTDIVLNGIGTPPSEAARRVREQAEYLDLIPGLISDSASFPLSSAELAELYSTNTLVGAEHEHCIQEGLIGTESLLLPSRFSELVESFQNIDLTEIEKFYNLWTAETTDANALKKALADLEQLIAILSSHSWTSAILEAGKIGPEQLAHWESLVNQVDEAVFQISRQSESVLKHGPKIDLPVTAQVVSDLRDIVDHLRSGRGLGFFSTLTKGRWKKIILGCSVDSGPARTLSHFESILAFAEIESLRAQITNRWNRQVVSAGGKPLPGDRPEIQAKHHLEVIRSMIDWQKQGWRRIEAWLSSQGFQLEDAHKQLRYSKQHGTHVDELNTLISEVLVPAIRGRLTWIAQEELKLRKEALLSEIAKADGKTQSKKTHLHRLSESVRKNDPISYEESFNLLLSLHSKIDLVARRTALLKRIENVAPTYAKALVPRDGKHGLGTPPNNIETAWNLKQYNQALDVRFGLDYAKVQREIDRIRAELQDVSAQYVEKLAWRYQLDRTGLKERQAITGWQQLQAKLTKSGRGKLDAVRKREAKKLLTDCKGSVPVWVMPLSKVFESFDLTTTKFDVVILDEASQSDITALVAFAIAKQIIVVGDSEQVTPQAVGQELMKIQGLIDELLDGVPNRMLYDGKTSVYDLAEQSFGETIRLVEHFRCVPNIIQFSNQLSYSGEIKPLRESASSPFDEHLVVHRVESSSTVNKINKTEAVEIASLIAAMTEMKEYSKTTIGVISLLGQEQAVVVDAALQRYLRPEIYEGHKILCGNASQFQGDERDVILISMVDTCDEPPLRIRQGEDFKKSFNVAASRARDQLWIVHSLNPATDLKPGDLRLRLIQHAENPQSINNAIEKAALKAESPFERLVMADLINAGYRVTPQWEVGAYRIDMIIEGKKSRIAFECDGDRYHPPEKLVDDIQRQLVLERLGWKFVRIRGSEYFRDPKRAMLRVLGELESLGVEKLGPSGISPINNGGVSEVRRRLLDRAFQIRRQWETEEQLEELTA